MLHMLFLEPMCASWADSNKRKVSVVGTVGEVGASYSIYEKNWFCPGCKHENYASRFRCQRCRTRKPEGTGNVIPDPVLSQGGAVAWKEAVDPKTQHLYYYNSATGETRWDRPAEMGHAPHASGWFGRGSTRSKVGEYEERNKRYLSRPARKQKEFIEANRSILEGTNEFNIWYGKQIGDQWDQGRGRLPAETKCDVEKDAGYTKADKSDAKNRHFCIHFARGMCARGSDCQYFHRIPTVADDASASELHDCFGRERHAKHRDDMDGVGSFTNPSRTLYIGGIQKSTYKSQEELEAALWKHFGDFGEVEHINFVPRLSIGFVRYRLRTNTEFAKEAMSNQKLDGEENLNLKWAYDDPNPQALKAIQRADADAALALLQSQGVNIASAAFDYPEHYQMDMPPTGQDGSEPPTKRLCGDGGGALAGGDPAMAYPNTDAQYPGYQSQEPQEPPAVEAGTQKAAASNGHAGNGAAPQGGEAKGGAAQGSWVAVWDGRYGAYYYYNALTNETVWQCPYPQPSAEEAKEAGQAKDSTTAEADKQQAEGEGGEEDDEEDEDSSESEEEEEGEGNEGRGEADGEGS